MNALGTALRYRTAGLSVFSRPYGKKWSNETWSHWQEQLPSEAEVREMFGNGQVNTAIAYGPASGNLIGLDCDSAQRYEEALAMMAGLGISTWTVKRPEVDGDPHNGGGTFFFRTNERATGRNLVDLEVKTGGYSLVPLSRHPSGVDYYIEAGSPEGVFTLPSLEALAPWVKLAPWEPLPSLAALEAQLSPRDGVPRKAWKILNGDKAEIDSYLSHSEAEQACLCSLINAGHDFESCLGLFLAHPAAGMFAEKHARDPREAFAWLELSYRNAANYVLGNPGVARQLAWCLRVWAQSHPWPGSTGATDHAVYLAHLHIAERCGCQPHGASCRELAQLAGIGKQAASRATARLQKAGLLQLAQAATCTLASTFYLVDVAECAERDTYSQHPVSKCPTTLTRHDAFRWSGLNKSGAEIWRVLLERGEASERDLVQATGRHRTTVKGKLMRMFQLGMVEPLGDGIWKAVPNVDLDAIAGELETAGKGEAQKEKHERERRAHQQALNRFSLPNKD